MAKSNKNYIDNKLFLAEIIEWRKKYYNELEKSGKEIKISDSIAEKLLLICNRITYRPNFRNYTFRDEMAEDALENSIRYFKTFDPDKSNNPFAYFSSVASMACVARINKEKRQMAIKAKYIQAIDIDEITIADSQKYDNISENINDLKEYISSYYNFDIEAYEKVIRDKKKKSAERKQAKLDALKAK